MPPFRPEPQLSDEAVRRVLENHQRQQQPAANPQESGWADAGEGILEAVELMIDAGDILEGVGEAVGALAEGAGELVGGLFEVLGALGS